MEILIRILSSLDRPIIKWFNHGIDAAVCVCVVLTHAQEINLWN